MSVEQRGLDVDVDLEENVATATVTEEISIEDLFVDGQLRLWEDEDGWSGYLIEDSQYFHVNTHFREDDWLHKRPSASRPSGTRSRSGSRTRRLAAQGGSSGGVRPHDERAGIGREDRRRAPDGSGVTVPGLDPEQSQDIQVDIQEDPCERCGEGPREELVELSMRDTIIEPLEEIRELTETSHGLADSENSNGGINKTQEARELTRNELVRHAAIGAPAWGGITVTVGDIQDMAKPKLELRHQLVDNAWGQLVEKWDCFERTMSDGNKVLKVSKSEISRDLARLVEHDLDRDDVVQRLFSENGEEA